MELNALETIPDSEVNNFDDNHATIDFDVCKSDHYIDDKQNSDVKPCAKTPLWIHKRIQNSHNQFLSLSQPNLQKLYQAPILKSLKRIEIPFKNKTKTKKEDRFKRLQQKKLSSKMKFKASKNESSSSEEEKKEDHSIEFGTEFNRKKISTTLPPETEAPTTEDIMPSSTEPLPIENDVDEEIDTEDHSVDFGGECDFDSEVEGEEGEAPNSNANSNSTQNGLGAAVGAGAGACFSGDTIVKILNGKEKRMDELKIGDWVLSGGEGKMGFSKIVSWLHRMPNVRFEFLKLTLENGKSLKITKKHFIYKFDCSASISRKCSNI
uniref:Hint domain-containing protein n=1 Tax=Panagrolaimus sp. PS1159 TaxID=55785 RepID=A0AC35GFM8_9BILA